MLKATQHTVSKPGFELRPDSMSLNNQFTSKLLSSRTNVITTNQAFISREFLTYKEQYTTVHTFPFPQQDTQGANNLVT